MYGGPTDAALSAFRSIPFTSFYVNTYIVFYICVFMKLVYICILVIGYQLKLNL